MNYCTVAKVSIVGTDVLFEIHFRTLLCNFDHVWCNVCNHTLWSNIIQLSDRTMPISQKLRMLHLAQLCIIVHKYNCVMSFWFASWNCEFNVLIKVLQWPLSTKEWIKFIWKDLKKMDYWGLEYTYVSSNQNNIIVYSSCESLTSCNSYRLKHV